jgi:hypothetical protein
MAKMFREIMSLSFYIGNTNNFEFSASKEIEACRVFVLVDVYHTSDACLQDELATFLANNRI